MNSVFIHSNYKDFLKSYIKENHKPGLIGELARAAGCDRTYFSQMLNSKVQLTPDHAHGLSEYFGFSDQDEEYFHLLLNKERAATKGYQAHLMKKITELQKKALNVSEKMKNKTEKLSEESMMTYYSDWRYAALHMIASIPELQSIDEIASRFAMSPIKVRKYLNDLFEMNLVRKEGTRFVHTGQNIHVSNESPHNHRNHFNWRMKALENPHDEENIHYTSIFTISKKDWPTLRNQLLNFIENQRKEIGKSGSEELFCFCTDLFQC